MSSQPGTMPAVPVWRPSGSRRVALDGFSPSPRGGSAAATNVLSWPTKDPSDVLDYEVDIAAAIAGNLGDGISGVSVTITPNAIGDLAVNNIATDGTTAVIWFSAGLAGTTYVVQMTISTNTGRVLHRAVLLPVQALAATIVPASALTTGEGAVVTDQGGNPILLGS